MWLIKDSFIFWNLSILFYFWMFFEQFYGLKLNKQMVPNFSAK